MRMLREPDGGSGLLSDAGASRSTAWGAFMVRDMDRRDLQGDEVVAQA
jgi:hypothetical protein